MKTVLTIAGFDPSSGAGITADLAVIAAHHLFGTACVTALTIQSTLGVQAAHAVDAQIVAQTLACLYADLPPAGIKIGMLANQANVEAVADFLAQTLAGHASAGQAFAGQTLPGQKLPGQARPPVVLDPVIRASSGRELLDPAGVEALRRRLLPLVDWLTPNAAELTLLTGRPTQTPAQIEEAAQALAAAAPGLGIVVTGGDPAPGEGDNLDCADDLLLAPNRSPLWLRGRRIISRATHGTGCAFSTALLCGLVASLDPTEAVRRAKAFVAQAIAEAEPRGGGKGPMNLLWPLREQR